MYTIFARNPGHALIAAIKGLQAGPIQEVSCEVGKLSYRVMPFPVAFVMGCPGERAISWPWWGVDPFAGFLEGLRMVVAASEGLNKIGDCRELHTCEFMMNQEIEQSALFKRSVNGCLDVMVFDRSRISLGKLFTITMCRYTMIQEFLAAVLGIPVGVYTHVSTDLVQQSETFPAAKDLEKKDPYEVGTIKSHPMIEGDIPTFVRDAIMLMEQGPTIGIQNRFIKDVATPIFQSCHALHSEESGRPLFQPALDYIAKCRASDWRTVCEDFIRMQKRNRLLDQVQPTPANTN